MAGAATGAVAGAVLAAITGQVAGQAAGGGASGAGKGAGGGAGPAHGTGYEDAISRRISGLEAEAKALREDLERTRGTLDQLTRDNAELRRANAALAASARRRGYWILALFFTALALAGVAAWLGGRALAP
jgi:hypothetical protein